MQTESEDSESEARKMLMPEFMVGYALGFGSVVSGMVLTALLFPKEKDENGKDDKKSVVR